jgi:hypothetical protein
MAKIIKKKKEDITDEDIEDIFSEDKKENLEEQIDDETQDASEISDEITNTDGVTLPINNPEENLDYITLGEKELGPAPNKQNKSFENANPIRKRLVQKTQVKTRHLPDYDSDYEAQKPFYTNVKPMISQELSNQKPTPNNFKKVANENPYFKDNNLKVVDSRTDLIYKYGILGLFAILIVVLANGAIRYDNYQQVSLNGTDAYVNASVNVNASVINNNNIYNNFTQPINVNINATIQLPQSVLNELARLGNLTNMTNST